MTSAAKMDLSPRRLRLWPSWQRDRDARAAGRFQRVANLLLSPQKLCSLMANFVDSSFEGQTIVLDGNDYLRCRFLRCRIIVTRGNFSVRECTFDTCNFEFSGEAENIRTLVLTLRNQRPTAAGN
jgi:hypothetical protein